MSNKITTWKQEDNLSQVQITAAETERIIMSKIQQLKSRDNCSMLNQIFKKETEQPKTKTSLEDNITQTNIHHQSNPESPKKETKIHPRFIRPCSSISKKKTKKNRSKNRAQQYLLSQLRKASQRPILV